jgi:hypothetical protein
VAARDAPHEMPGEAGVTADCSFAPLGWPSSPRSRAGLLKETFGPKPPAFSLACSQAFDEEDRGRKVDIQCSEEGRSERFPSQMAGAGVSPCAV